ncbi:MAG TPA: FIST N-terminal domain-containing protein [Solirubrobacterales bacterium]|nr:FIST N-terminal domain-containing protein [Solirubrobacterales bacterium]
MEGLSGDPGLVLAFTSGDRDFERDATEMADAAGGVASAGMTGKGLFGPEGPLDEGCVTMAFGSQVGAAVAASEEASGDLRTAGQACTAEALEKLGTDADLVLLFIDSTRGDIADTVSGAYEAAGPAIPLAGGAAGGTEKRHFHDGRASSDSIVAVAIHSERPLGLGNTQTCKTRGTPSILTRSNGQLVEEIDGRPAEEVYLEQLGFAGLAFDDEQFESMAITHPIAQPELHGDFRLRHVLGRTEEGAIVLGTGIPESAVIEFTELDFEDLLTSGAASVRDAIDALGGGDPKAALVFDCAGRRRALRDGIPQEVEAITAALGDPAPPTVGLYTHGEVARLRGAKGDRNHAVVTVAFG